MNLKEITSQAEWESIAAGTEFLQSFHWGEFQKAAGNNVLRLGIYNERKLVHAIQAFVHDVGFGFRYLYIPRADISEDVIGVLKNYAQEHGFFCIRIEPVSKQVTNVNDRKMPGEARPASNRQPQHTLVLNLLKDEEKLLSEMHEKTRYNIRLAVKKGVEIREGKNIDVFWELNKQTIERDTFKSHDKLYYEKMLQSPICHQLTAYYENKPIACNLYISFNRVCTYLHGASSNEFRNVMAPYVLQWTGIQFAKKFGCTAFDFWGIAPDMKKEHGDAMCLNGFCWDKNHKWSGVTRFKVGFGGTRKSYPDAYEIAVNEFKYKLFKLVKLIR